MPTMIPKGLPPSQQPDWLIHIRTSLCIRVGPAQWAICKGELYTAVDDGDGTVVSRHIRNGELRSHVQGGPMGQDHHSVHGTL